jgi:hypothetical protein
LNIERDLSGADYSTPTSDAADFAGQLRLELAWYADEQEMEAMRSPVGACLILAAAAVLTGCTSDSQAGSSRAGLVIVHGDGRVQTSCVEFEGSEARGYEVLHLAGAGEIVDAGNAMGVLVCSIEGEGCDFPAHDCLCECQGPGSCTYWAYFARSPGEDWVYSPLGASQRPVRDGDLQAWVWLSGTTPAGPEVPPVPDLTFEEVCSAGEADATGSP